MKKLLLFLLVSCASFYASAQTTVNGVVSSAEGTMPGVSVTVKGTALGTATDLDGNFSITIPTDKAVLVFTYIGYKTKEISVTGGGNARNLRVFMEEDNTMLDELIVVGYGTVRKRDLTGAVSSLSGGRLNESVVTNIDQMLQGKVSGVQITQNTGAPGGAASVRIRGAQSINNTNEPLYVIDGIPFSGAGSSISGFDWAGGSNGQNVVNPLSTIAPSDIVSIDVLKDASATAIYGANGANGVILVTTKRGKAGSTNITYDGNLSYQSLAKRVDVMNLSEYAQYQKDIASFLNSNVNVNFQDPSILGKGTDWQNEIFRTAIMQSHQLSINGGDEKIQYAASGGWMSQEGIVIGSDFERFNSRVNVDGKLNEYVKAGGSLAFTRTNETIINNDGVNGTVMNALTSQPDIPVYDFDGSWAGPDSQYSTAETNPVWYAKNINNKYERNRVMGNFYLSIDPIKGLNYRSEYGFDVSNNNNTAFVPSYKLGAKSNSINKILQHNDRSNYWIWKNYATYNKSVDAHTFSIMLGTEASASNWSGDELVKQNLSSNDIRVMTKDGEFVSNNGWKDKSTSVSVFGRLNYNYLDRYLLTATLRADGSSKFGQNKKWGYFPSAAFAWRISQEDFLKDNETISNLKLRLGYGQVGNSSIGNYLYSSSMTSVKTPFGTGYRPANIPNPDLHWEASEQYNGGIDFGMLKERISFTVDFYLKNTKDLLMRVDVPSYLGGGSYNDIQSPMINAGKIRNKGVDLALNTVNIDKRDFSWTSNLVFSLNRNKVLDLNGIDEGFSQDVDWYAPFKAVTRVIVGQPIGTFYGYKVDRLFTSKEDILNSPVQLPDDNNPKINKYTGTQNAGIYPGDIKFKDLDNNGVIDSRDQTVIGDPNPDFTFGFTNTFRVKNVEIGLGLSGAYGFDILNVTKWWVGGIGTNLTYSNLSKDAMDFARIAKDANGDPYLVNTGTLIPRPTTTDPQNNQRMSDWYLEDGSYLRIQNLSLAYNVPSQWLRKFSVKNVKISVNAQNLYTFTKYSGYDPEIGAFNQSALLQNVDRGHYPTPRSVTFGLNIGF